MSAATGRWDVIVVGGGSAGVAAAVGAAQCGGRTLLIESQGFLGGAATRSLVLAWCGIYPQRPPPRPQPAVAGVLQQVMGHLDALGMPDATYFSGSGNWPMPLNPEATKLALDRTLRQAGVPVHLHSLVVNAHVSAGRIEAIDIQDPAGRHTLQARSFVDASGDSALTALAAATPCPLHASQSHHQPASFPVRLTGVVFEQVQDKASRAQALAKLPPQLGCAHLRQDGGILTPIPSTDDVWWLGIEVECDGLHGTSLSQAEQDGRDLAWQAVHTLRTQSPGFARANISATGPKVGVRETRHMATVEPLREADVLAGRLRGDGIGKGCWPMEIHHAPGHVEYRRVGGDGCYDIGLGALQSADLANCWLSGRNLGADASAYASARVMGTSFATGHAAGVAAALGGSDVQAVRRALQQQGAIL